jgi:hypothetical protein
MAGRQPPKPAELKIGDATLHSLPLGYEASEDLLPDIAYIIAQVLGKMPNEDSEDIAILGPVLAAAAGCLQGGTLKRLAPQLLATTTAIAPDEKGLPMRYSLGKLEGDDGRAAFFELYPEAYLMSLYHAGRTTYGRFFPASALQGLRARVTKALTKS